MRYAIKNEATGEYARHDCQGQHDGRFTTDFAEAKRFETYGEASDYCDNFGPDWNVED